MKTLKEYAEEVKSEGMKCNCDLDNWEPEPDTGHSHVCDIHKTAHRRFYSYDASKRRKKIMKAKTLREEKILVGLNEATELSYAIAKKSGFHSNLETGEPKLRNFGEAIALMHSELSEALEAHRKDLMDDKLPHRKGVEVEFADTIIRILDTGKAYGLDVPGAFVEKSRYNEVRSDHKVENRRKEGGKKY